MIRKNQWGNLSGDVLAEIETRADRKTRGQAAVLQKIAEQMVIYQVRLHSQCDVLGK